MNAMNDHEPVLAIDTAHNHLINENVRLKLILLDVVDQYGDRGEYGGALFPRQHQPEVIQRAIDAIKEVMP